MARRAARAEPDLRLTILNGVLDAADIENVPEGPVPDALISAGDNLSGFRYQILVSVLAKRAGKLPVQGARGVAPTELRLMRAYAAADTYLIRKARDPAFVANVLRWSDVLRCETVGPTFERILHWSVRPTIPPHVRPLYSLACASLALDVVSEIEREGL